jgi:hypothetical protein
VVALKQLWFLKEQSQKHARKHIKIGRYLKVTLVYRGLKMNLQKIGRRSRNVAQGRKDGGLIKIF